MSFFFKNRPPHSLSPLSLSLSLSRARARAHTHTHTSKYCWNQNFFLIRLWKIGPFFLIQLSNIWGHLVVTHVKYVLYPYVPNNWGMHGGSPCTQINTTFKLHSPCFCAQPQSLCSFTAETNPVFQELSNKHYTSLTLTTCRLHSYNGDTWAISFFYTNITALKLPSGQQPCSTKWFKISWPQTTEVQYLLYHKIY
jgi:hypothetical protein